MSRLGRRLLREEDGGFLIEILVSAAILLVLAVGVIAAFDTATAQSGQQRSQAVAANLAASELERLRSLRYADLVGLNTTLPVKTVGGTKYTITSQSGEVLAPQAGGSGCDVSSRSPEALRITTAVTWPTQGTRRPVRLTSMVAAPANQNSSRGNLVVQVVNKDGFGVPSLPINLAGPSAASATTDVNGCVRFTDLIAGNGYTLSFQRSGWLTTPGNVEAFSEALSIVAGATQTKAYQYDPASPAQATFVWSGTGAAGGTEYNARQLGVAWVHSGLSGGRLAQTPISPSDHVVTSPNLPASASPYGVHAGSCVGNQPPAGANFASVLSPGGTVKVRVPTLRVRLTYGGTGTNAGRIFVTTCDGTFQLMGTNGTGLTGSATFAGSTRDGVIMGGVPYAPAAAPLQLCADAPASNVRYRAAVNSYQVTNFTAPTEVTLAATSTNIQTGLCV